VHESPFVVPLREFPREGGYRVDLQALSFGNWIRATRWFQVHKAEPPKPAPEARPESPPQRPAESRDLLRALTMARAARDKAQERSKSLRDENAVLRGETERLTKQVETLAQTQEEDAAHAEELERRLAQLAEANRALANENALVRQRLSSVVPCTVWGYYSFPRPQTLPVTRRILMVSDTVGRIFRGQLECETLRHDDPTAASVCFCAGNSWGG
jgi:hypothetical protein